MIYRSIIGTNGAAGFVWMGMKSTSKGTLGGLDGRVSGGIPRR